MSEVNNVYRFAAEQKVWQPLTVRVRNDEGVVVEQKFQVLYRILKRKEQREWMRKVTDRDEFTDDVREVLIASLDEDRIATYDAMVKGRIHGLRGMVNHDTGKPLDLSPDLLDAMAEDPVVWPVIDRGLWQASREAPAGN